MTWRVLAGVALALILEPIAALGPTHRSVLAALLLFLASGAAVARELREQLRSG